MSITVEDYIDFPELREDLDPHTVTEMFLSRIADREDLNAVVSVSTDRAQADTERVVTARRNGKPLPLNGLPILIKDNIDVAAVPCRRGSPLFAKNIATSDAECVRLLSEAGAVILGKTTLHELVYGGTTESPFYGRTKNPWNTDRIVGGSSGGSGAAVAAGLCAVALGSDTGGSVRLPAHLNGVVGLRPTFGSVSVRGVQPIGASFDTVGPLARHARDTAAVYAAMSHHDWEDCWSSQLPIPERTAMNKAAILDETTIGHVEPGVRTCINSAIAILRHLGVQVRELPIDGFTQAREDIGTIIRTEAWVLYKDDLVASPEKFSPATAERLHSGSSVTADEVILSTWRLANWRQRIRQLLAKEFDLLVLPSAPAIAPITGSAGLIATTELLTSLTSPISAAHVPALSVPCGFAEGMPVGVQIVAAPGREQDLISLGAQIQKLLPPSWPPHESLKVEANPSDRTV